MPSSRINTGYKRLGIVMGAVAAVVAAILTATDEENFPFWLIALAGAIFFVIHSVAVLGLGWAHANMRNPDRVYSAGARTVSVLAPLALVAYIVYTVSKLKSAVTLSKFLMKLIALPFPVFVVVVTVVSLTLAVRWVAHGFMQSKAESKNNEQTGDHSATVDQDKPDA